MQPISDPKNNPYDLAELYNMIKISLEKLGSNSEKEAILILGPTGAGKSTLTYLLANKPLLASENEEGIMVITSKEKLEGVVISDKKKSETKIPSKVRTEEGLVIWDCPGFTDTSNYQEIANAFYLQKVFEMTKFLKFILVISEGQLYENRGSAFINILKHFQKLFRNPNSLENKVSLVISRASKTRNQYLASLNKIMNENPNSKDLESFFRIVLKSIELFPVPKESGLINAKNEIKAILLGVEKNTQYLETKKNSIEVVLSENAMDLAMVLFEKSKEKLQEIIVKIEKLCEEFNTAKNMKISYLIEEFSNKELYFSKEKVNENLHLMELLILECQQIFKRFCESLLNQNSHEFFFEMKKGFVFVINALNQFLKIDQRIFIDDVIEKITHVEFISKVNVENKSLFDKIFLIFQNFNVKLDSSIKTSINSIQVNEIEENKQYFQRVKFFLDLFCENPESQIKVSTLMLCVARIDFLKRDYENSLISCLESFERNVNNLNSFPLINKIFTVRMDLVSQIQAKEIFIYLIKENNLAMEENLNNIIELCGEYKKNEAPKDQIKYLLDLCKVHSNLSELVQISIFSALEKFENRILDILMIINSEQIDLQDLQKSFKKLMQMTKILHKFETAKVIKFDKVIQTWVKFFKNLQCEIGIALFVKIKNIEYQKNRISIEDLKSIIYLMSLDSDIPIFDDLNEVITIKNHPEIVKIRANVFDCLGDKFFEINDFENSSLNFISAITDNNKIENSYRKLAEIFFLTGNAFIDKINHKTLNSIISFNKNEFLRIFSEFFKTIFLNFKANHSFFNFGLENHELTEIFYYEKLREVLKLISTIYNAKNLNALFEIQEIWSNLIDKEQIKKIFSSKKNAICEKFLRNENQEDNSKILKNDLIIEQFNYISNLMKKNEAEIFLKFYLFEDKLFQINIGTPLENEIFFEKKLEELYFDQGIKNIQYYQRIIELIEPFARKNIICAKIASYSYFYIGKIEVKEVSFYEIALEFDDQFYNLCSNQKKTDFYYENTLKRLISDNLGLLFMNFENYLSAWNCFVVSKNHSKIKQISKIMMKNEPENIGFLVKIGDYYAEVGMSEKANDKYREVIGLCYEKEIISKMYVKISNAEEKRKNLGTDCLKIAKNIVENKMLV